MSDKYFGLNLDELFEELWSELERIQDGTGGHTIAIEADTPEIAVTILSGRLRPFLIKRMYPSGRDGYELED